MKDYLNLWSHELLKLTSLTVKSKVMVTGQRDQHLGPRWDFAKIQVSIEPAHHFEVIDATSPDKTRPESFLDWAVFGLLDVLMVAQSAPLTNIRITFEKVEHHPTKSSNMAFRHAGRDAGRKVIEYFRMSKPPSG